MNYDEFELLSNFIYRKTGIRFESKKQYFMVKRIEKRIKALNLESAADYIRLLRFSDPRGAEFQNLTECLTINETYFFRDFPQMRAFAENCLEEVIARKRQTNDYTLHLWSAGCSTGEEPYTLAIILVEMLDDWRSWDLRITASDIDRVALEKARKAEYEQRSIRDVPPEYLARYFIEKGESWRLKPEMSRLVSFEHLNLGDREFIRHHRDFDFIFCRNMLIYFDDVSRKNLVDHFYVALKPGGFIFLGSRESVGRISTAFRIKRAGDHLVYYTKL